MKGSGLTLDGGDTPWRDGSLTTEETVELLEIDDRGLVHLDGEFVLLGGTSCGTSCGTTGIGKLDFLGELFQLEILRGVCVALAVKDDLDIGKFWKLLDHLPQLWYQTGMSALLTILCAITTPCYSLSCITFRAFSAGISGVMDTS